MKIMFFHYCGFLICISNFSWMKHSVSLFPVWNLNVSFHVQLVGKIIGSACMSSAVSMALKTKQKTLWLWPILLEELKVLLLHVRFSRNYWNKYSDAGDVSGKQRCAFKPNLLRVRGGGSGAYSSRATIHVGAACVADVPVPVRNATWSSRSCSLRSPQLHVPVLLG